MFNKLYLFYLQPALKLTFKNFNMRAPRLIALFAGILSFYSLTAQTNRPKIKYGDVSEKDFEPKVYSVDSSADAVYIYDVGESRYRENNNASFDVVFKRHARIRLLNKNSFDLATIEIQLYKYVICD